MEINQNIKDLLTSNNMDDVRLGLEICKRSDISIKEISNLYHSDVKGTVSKYKAFLEYLNIDYDWNPITDSNYHFFTSWKTEKE